MDSLADFGEDAPMPMEFPGEAAPAYSSGQAGRLSVSFAAVTSTGSDLSDSQGHEEYEVDLEQQDSVAPLASPPPMVSCAQPHRSSRRNSDLTDARRVGALRIGPSKGAPKTTVGENLAQNNFVDQLKPEDIGISFCIRALADFDKVNADKKAMKDYTRLEQRHLHGLSDIFPAISDECTETKALRHSTGRSHSRVIVTMNWIISTLACCARRKTPARMACSVTSSLGVRTQFGLTTSALLSCVFVVGSIAVDNPGCHHGGSPALLKVHVASSLLYAFLSAASRCYFTRVDFARGEELTDWNDVLLSHLTSPGLFFDALALGGLIAEVLHLGEPAVDLEGVSLPSAVQWAMLLQLFKAWRVLLPEDGSDVLVQARGFFQGILKLLLYLVLFAHVVGCSFLFLGNVEESQGDKSWLDDSPADIDMRNCRIRYTEAFYFAIIGLTAVGYEDVLVTSVEHSLNSFFLIISQLVAAKVCADLTWLLSMYNQHEFASHERRRGLERALDKMSVPKVLVQRVLAFQSYENTMHADNMEKQTFNGLSRNLMEELRLCTYRKLVLQAPFLREQPTEVVSLIINALVDEVYLPSDFIVRAGELGRELFFVRRGEARAFLGPHVPVWGQTTCVATIKAGSYFGELAMLTGLPRGSFVMAASYCICSVLPYSAVETLVEMHPEAFTTLVQTMVRIYNLKPEATWSDLSLRLTKKFSIYNDQDAFEWLRSHDEQPDVEELYAKAFDAALQKLKVAHLDRRIFWSELDRDASGGISFQEFQGKLYFEDAPPTTEASGMDQARANSIRSSVMSAKSEKGFLSVSRQGSVMSRESSKSSVRNSCMSVDSNAFGSSQSGHHLPSPRPSNLLTVGSTSFTPAFDGESTEKTFLALLEENRRLITEIRSLTSTPLAIVRSSESTVT